MELDASTCYRAIAGRDRRFEGRFVVAVVTTGIYCRPGCPAPLPRRKNVRFYLCPAAAEEAGFRPCLRCRPDSSPGSPLWLGTSATVSRALRLIEAGALDDGGVEDLAARLGIGDRHLRRLFITHLGATPQGVAQTRRAHFARKLLDETDLSMTRVALGAGYTSVRRFNDAIRRTFHQTPGALRRSRTAGDGSPASLPAGRLVLKLPFRPPLDWKGMLGFLGPRAVPGVEAVDGAVYRRTVRLAEGPGTLEVRPAPGGRHLRLVVQPPGPGNLMGLVGRVSRLFDLGADSERIAAHLKTDPALAPALAAHRGLRVPGAWDPFELSVRAILGQQVSVRGATTLAGRLARKFGEPLGPSLAGPRGRDSGKPPGAAVGEPLTHLFPTPERLADADLASIGLPRARAAAIRGVAAAVRDGALRFDGAGGLEEIVAALSALPGIGEWTAHYIAMRALGEPDALPAADLGLRHALARRGVLPSSARVMKRAEAWRPWRAYATMALWMELSRQPKG